MAISPGSWTGIWWIAKTCVREVFRDNLAFIAASLAFYGLLALFPTIVALVSVFGLVANPLELREQLRPLSEIMPLDAWSLLDSELMQLATSRPSSLTLGFAVSTLIALWSSSRGMMALIAGLNITVGRRETRNVFVQTATALFLAVGFILFMIATVVMVTVLPVIFEVLDVTETGESLAKVVRWPLLAIIAIFVLSVVYRLGPVVPSKRWSWLTWGAIVAAAFWILGSIGFSLVVRRFMDFHATYGSLSAMVTLMMWLYLSAFVVLIGSEVNATLDRLRDAADEARDPHIKPPARGFRIATVVASSPDRNPRFLGKRVG